MGEQKKDANVTKMYNAKPSSDIQGKDFSPVFNQMQKNSDQA